MMMTAAGTVPARQGFRDGRGRRRPAGSRPRAARGIVTATDVRPAVKEQVAKPWRRSSLRSRTRVQAGGDGGWLRQRKCRRVSGQQAALVAEHIKKQDIVITTALIPGRAAPRLISADMVKSMKPGS